MPSDSRSDDVLSAAEALVLLNPNRKQGWEAIKLTLLELIAQRRILLTAQEHGGVFRKRRTTHSLRCLPESVSRVPMHGHVREVHRVLRDAGAGTGMEMRRVVQVLGKAFGPGMPRYLTRHVLPEMEARGLLVSASEPFLRFFSRTRHRCTPEGQALQSQLQEVIEKAKTLPLLLQTDPPQAAALAATLGSVALLVDELRAHSSQLAAALRSCPTSDGSMIDLALDIGAEAWDLLNDVWDDFDHDFDSDHDSDSGD